MQRALWIGLLTRQVCVGLLSIALLSLPAVGQESATAILRSNGGVLLDRNLAPNSAALYPNNLIETQKAAFARIEASGSAADINPETVVQFEGDELVLDHGSLSVNTSRGLRVRVGCVTVTPVNVAEWTRYEVTDVNGKITVVASKSDAYIDARSRNQANARKPARSERSIVREGEQKSREEKCGAADEQNRGSADGPILNSPWARAAGVAAIAGLMCWALCPNNDHPMSPAAPGTDHSPVH